MDLNPANPLDALSTLEGYRSHFMDEALWTPFVHEVAGMHRLSCSAIRAGHAGTFPTFIVEDRWVAKFFGPLFEGESCWRVEAEAAEMLEDVPEMPIARLRTSGKLVSSPDWRYLVFDYVPGVSFGEAYEQLDQQARLALARWLGRALERMHGLAVSPRTSLPRLTPEKMLAWSGGRRANDWPGWPGQLAAQADVYLASALADFGPPLAHFIHADLTRDHLLGILEGGSWTRLAVIDFGDAMLGDLYYELAALHLDLFGCDKHMLAAFLESYGLAPDAAFPRRAMAAALGHQFDVLGPVFAARPYLRDLTSLDQLAKVLWDADKRG